MLVSNDAFPLLRPVRFPPLHLVVDFPYSRPLRLFLTSSSCPFPGFALQSFITQHPAPMHNGRCGLGRADIGMDCLSCLPQTSCFTPLPTAPDVLLLPQPDLPVGEGVPWDVGTSLLLQVPSAPQGCEAHLTSSPPPSPFLHSVLPGHLGIFLSSLVSKVFG